MNTWRYLTCLIVCVRHTSIPIPVKYEYAYARDKIRVDVAGQVRLVRLIGPALDLIAYSPR